MHEAILPFMQGALPSAMMRRPEESARLPETIGCAKNRFRALLYRAKRVL